MARQVDLFLDQLIDAPIKDERALMEFPFFAIQKRPRMEPFVYDDGTVRIEVRPGDRGVATIYDKDVLIYCCSLINERLERGAPVDKTISFAAHDFLKVTGRGTGKRDYELFLDALHRLRSTTINTTITAGGEKERRGFGWLNAWRVIERTTAAGQKVMAGVEVELNAWIYRALVKDRRVLTINRDYFRLSKGLERRLYELARKHCGSQQEWWIGLERLAAKCGSQRELRKFKHDLAQIAKAGNIPDYDLAVVEQADAQTPFKTADKQPMALFRPKGLEILAQERPEQPVAPVGLADEDKPLVASLGAFEEARRLYPGYDLDHIERAWRRATLASGTKLRHPDKAFLAWCAAYVERNKL